MGHLVARVKRVGDVNRADQPALRQPDHPSGCRRLEIGDGLKASQYVIGSHSWGYLPYD